MPTTTSCYLNSVHVSSCVLSNATFKLLYCDFCFLIFKLCSKSLVLYSRNDFFWRLSIVLFLKYSSVDFQILNLLHSLFSKFETSDVLIYFIRSFIFKMYVSSCQSECLNFKQYLSMNYLIRFAIRDLNRKVVTTE